jgi:hypothetical protein
VVTVNIDHHDERLLSALGYSKTHHPASWEDVGGVESGPRLIGGPAHDLWQRGEHCLVVECGELVDSFCDPLWLTEG